MNGNTLDLQRFTFAPDKLKPSFMKRLFVLLVCAASLTTASAQVSFGGKAGMNVSSYSGTDNDGMKSKIGFHIGAFAQVPVQGSFSVQPELVFSMQGAKSEYLNENVKYNIGYLNIPVLAKYTHSSGLYGETGPQFGFLLSAKSKYDGDSENIKDDFKKFDLSWGFGAGYKVVENISVGLRYNLGLVNVIDNDDTNLKNSVLQVGVAYTLGSK
jgi:opacity protein-like surface antigen